MEMLSTDVRGKAEGGRRPRKRSVSSAGSGGPSSIGVPRPPRLAREDRDLGDTTVTPSLSEVRAVLASNERSAVRILLIASGRHTMVCSSRNP